MHPSAADALNRLPAAREVGAVGLQVMQHVIVGIGDDEAVVEDLEHGTDYQILWAEEIRK